MSDQTVKITKNEENITYPKKKLEIIGINLPVFIVLAVIVFAGIYLEILPLNFASGLAVTMVIGGILITIGNSIPVFSTFGGGPLLCIIIPALLAYLGVFPESLSTLADTFYNEFGFAELVVTGLIIGSILSMDRELLIKVGIRFFIPLLGGLAATIGVGGLVGHLVGFGFSETILYIVGPIMGGGMAAGAVPMSEVYAASGNGDAASYLALITPSIMVGNIICILIAGGLNGIGKKRNLFKGFTGHGQILRSADASGTLTFKKESNLALKITNLISGIILATSLYIFGQILAQFFPTFHPYVYIILAAGLLKIFNVLPERMNQAAGQWYEFISVAWIPAVLVSISLGMIDFNSVLEIIANPSYMGLTILTVVLAALGAGFIGMLVGFYFVESSITAGLGMADMGGSGDVAVLSASERMGLMPFMQLSSRIGGAIMLVILSILAPFLL